MSIVPMGPPQPGETTDSKDTTKPRGRPLVAAFLSALIPGSGQLLLGQRRNGSIFLALFVTVLLGFWPLRLPRLFLGSVLLSLSWINLSIHAAYRAGWSSIPEYQRPSKSWLAVVLLFALIALWFIPDQLMLAAGFRVFTIPSLSMEPAVRRGDRIVADMDYYGSRAPKDEEIILFERGPTFFIKRVIASGGESVEGRGGNIYVNGNLLSETYVQHTGGAEPWMNDFGPVIVPVGEFFVTGDNRDISIDSRLLEHGLVTADSIAGKPLYVVFNFGSRRAGKVIH